MPLQFSPPLKYGVAHARKLCPRVRIITWFPLVRRVLAPVIGSQLISDCLSVTRCSLVSRNASLFFPPLKYGVAYARKICHSVRIRTWFPLVRRVLEPVIGSQLISDYISGTRRTVVLRKFAPVISWLKDAVAHPTNIGLSQCTDKNMIPNCAQSSAACDWLTINFWLYFSYTMFRGAMQCLSIFSTIQVWGSPCENGLSQCTDNNMIPSCAQSSGACDWLTINFWLYYRYSTYCGAMQISSSYFVT